MRSFIGLMAMVVLLATACKKDRPYNDSLAGSWKEVLSVDGFSGRAIPIAEDSARILYLKNDKTFEFLLHGTVVAFGVYDTLSKISVLSNAMAAFISFGQNPALQDLLGQSQTSLRYSIYKDTLSLSFDAYDAGGKVYKRLK
jgi:hypothetical protein